MERKKNSIVNYSIPFLYIMYSVGIAGHLIEPLRGLMKTLTPFTLLLTGGLVIYTIVKEDSRIIKWLAVTYLITFVLEVVGVKTGYVFGAYSYGDVLGFKVFDAPLIIGMNWVLVILGAVLISLRVSKNKYIVSLLTAVLSVVFDFVLEPVAINLGYWTWVGGEIPSQNYLAWFVIAFIFSYLYCTSKISLKTKIPVHYFSIQFVFFLVLAMAL